MGIIDANVLIRYKTNDHLEQADKARLLIEKVMDGLEVGISEAVIAEVVYVLTSKVLYNLPREEVKDYLTQVLTIKHVVMSNKAVVLRALSIFSYTKLDFVDALLAAYVDCQKFDHIITFDEKIAKATSVRIKMLSDTK